MYVNYRDSGLRFPFQTPKTKIKTKIKNKEQIKFDRLKYKDLTLKGQCHENSFQTETVE